MSAAAREEEAVCRLDELSEEGITPVRAFGHPAGAVRVGETPHVFAARCPHMGGPLDRGQRDRLLAASAVGCPAVTDRWVVRCPWHGWEFDVESGASVADPRTRILVYDARVVDDMVVIRRRRHR